MSSDGDDRCPACGEGTRFYLNCAPGVFFCESCELEFWQEGGRWYCCDADGEPRRVAVADGGQSVDDTDREGEVEWYYAIDHSGRYETRHEAVGEAAIVNRGRGDRRRDVTVWAYPECGCEESVVTLAPGRCCGRCGAVIA